VGLARGAPLVLFPVLRTATVNGAAPPMRMIAESAITMGAMIIRRVSPTVRESGAATHIMTTVEYATRTLRMIAPRTALEPGADLRIMTAAAHAWAEPPALRHVCAAVVETSVARTTAAIPAAAAMRVRVKPATPQANAKAAPSISAINVRAGVNVVTTGVEIFAARAGRGRPVLRGCVFQVVAGRPVHLEVRITDVAPSRISGTRPYRGLTLRTPMQPPPFAITGKGSPCVSPRLDTRVVITGNMSIATNAVGKGNVMTRVGPISTRTAIRVTRGRRLICS